MKQDSNQINGEYRIDNIIEFIEKNTIPEQEPIKRRRMVQLSEKLNNSSGITKEEMLELWGITNDLFKSAIFIFETKTNVKIRTKDILRKL